jgi:hypothetical protein
MGHEQAMRDRFQRMSDAELAEVIGPLKDTYTPEAAEAAEAEVAARGEAFDPSGSVKSMPERGPDAPAHLRHGVEGWLGILAGWVLLSGAGTILFGLAVAAANPAWLMTAPLGLYTLYAGILLWQAHSDAPRHVNIALLLILVLQAGFGLVRVALAGASVIAGGDSIAFAIGALGPAAVTAAWLGYLHRSWRVASTFPAFHQQWPRPNPEPPKAAMPVSQ